MNYILKMNSYYVCSREFNLSGSVSYSDIRDAALDEMVADLRRLHTASVSSA